MTPATLPQTPQSGSLLGLLRALQLSCPTLPIGAYAYSQGLEQAVQIGWVRDEQTTKSWVLGLLSHTLGQLDLPLLRRMHEAWHDNEPARVARLSQELLANRESHELYVEDQHLGRGLANVLAALPSPHDEAPAGLTPEALLAWAKRPEVSYAAMFAAAGVRYDIDADTCAGAYAFAWCEHQVSAATRLVPLGQTAAQRVLDRALTRIPEAVARSGQVKDSELGLTTPGLAMASAWHETQYTRLFRS